MLSERRVLLWFAAHGFLAAARPLSVLYFVCDDLRPGFLAAYDQKVMITPTLDKLASEALVFDKAYCSVAVCSPSRNRSSIWAAVMCAPLSVQPSPQAVKS
jgi:hypothetical protein